MYNQAALHQAIGDMLYCLPDKKDYTVRPEHLRNALVYAGFSPRQPIDANGRIARCIKPWLKEGLPEKDELVARLLDAKLHANLANASYWLAAYRTEELYKTGQLEQFCTRPADRQGYVDQRDKLFDLYHTKEHSYGHGLKTISFVQLLLWPYFADVVPVDTWVLTWTNSPEDATPKKRARYLEIEQVVSDARHEDGLDDLPLGQYHWLRWDLAKNGACEQFSSHRDMCPFD